ncbi:hypothetical protein BOSEA31B_11939 [Hyphomicrobiales bacterium]|nr:hypothetical protein BOSEA31B_11939 [Hyphomicrobiales bacterium]CAH1697718.1 hypothetical protein BOSEA1005_10763 [Hyphomicrobiales bacterium]CAI0347365.1 hypothetical protein BO1005MUT1_70146 [Hyphomicrobiales bacterium]
MTTAEGRRKASAKHECVFHFRPVAILCGAAGKYDSFLSVENAVTEERRRPFRGRRVGALSETAAPATERAANPSAALVHVRSPGPLFSASRFAAP